MRSARGGFKLIWSSYNSVVFTTVSTRGYVAMQFNSTTKATIENGTFTPTIFDPISQVTIASIYSDAYKNKTFEKISALDCIDAYRYATVWCA
jgi:hypothetical protein